MLIRPNLYPMHYSATHLSCPRPALLLFWLSLLPATGMAQCDAQQPEYTPTSAFILRADGTVQHQKTGLIWSRCSVGQVWQDNTCLQTASTHTYFAAFEQAQRANAAHYLGFTTWHLPSVEELQSLVELRCARPAINTTLFPNTPSSWYWSASLFADFPWYGRPVDFGNGTDEIFYKINYQNTPLPVRLVVNPKEIKEPALGIDSDNDGVSDSLESSKNTNLQRKDNDIRQDENFIAQLYRDLLLREATASEIAQQLRAAQTDRSSVVLALASSAEYSAQQLPLAIAYALLIQQQIPTPAWLQEWRTLLHEGLSAEALIDEYMQHSALKESYLNANPADYIRLLAVRVLGRNWQAQEQQQALADYQAMGKAGFTVYCLSHFGTQQLPPTKPIVIQIASLLANYALDSQTLEYYSHLLATQQTQALDLIKLIITSNAYQQRFYAP